MKHFIIKALHFILGYERYLKVFSIFKIRTLSLYRRKSDYVFFTKLLPDDATIVVIGACTGITTVPFAKGKPNRKVIAYEPLASNFKALSQVLTHFNLTNIAAYNVGLGNTCEVRELILPVLKGVKKQGIAHIKDSTITEHNEGIIETTSLDLLDNRNELTGLKIDAIKVVAENFEYQILEGAKSTLQKNKPIIYCELWDNEKRQAVLELIKKYDYGVFYREGTKLVPYDKKKYAGKNFFFKPVHA